MLGACIGDESREGGHEGAPRWEGRVTGLMEVAGQLLGPQKNKRTRERPPAPRLMGVESPGPGGAHIGTLYLPLISHQLVSALPLTSRDPHLAGLCAPRTLAPPVLSEAGKTFPAPVSTPFCLRGPLLLRREMYSGGCMLEFKNSSYNQCYRSVRFNTVAASYRWLLKFKNKS